MQKKIGITETVLRDAHQSLIATRMTTQEMLPMLEQLDKIGFHSLECWGGATYDACLRLTRTRGQDFALYAKSARTLSSRCFSEDRTCSATDIMPTMLLNTSCSAL